jgi:crotonobetainyl-CoA:carnitine CoA-transferase CaiB-like acyl-CoA transferase
MTGKTDTNDTLPLHGVRVVEFCQTIMGPSCGLVLADLGADVIKVEPAPDGDKTRRLHGFAAGFFPSFNRNKRSVALDLKSKEGVALAHRLIQSADVVTENYAPGTMERLGCGYDVLSKLNPRLIYCAMKGFLSGPYEKRPALDEVVQFMAGLAYMTGPPGRPLRAGASIIDIMGGTYGAMGILAALRDRDRTGKGQFVKSALFESTAFLMMQHMAGEVVTGQDTPPMPNRRGAWAVYEVFKTADDDQIFIGITSDNHWRRFCQEFGRQDLLDDPALKTNEDRVRSRDRIIPVCTEIFGSRTKAELAAICEKIEIPFAPVHVKAI